ncbi:hypothetical protein FPSE_00290 [Fusarium pseudograminearum CS3096]|uniref:Dipeptidyl peptidase III n=1 Tax=Fusarium pseudograminearum (strain CS3096) TaxID=1028729 RepID=K3W3L4_FUSPC|nr:hypothetical protein FPSE_00290 [Fusarium pseudograminearum CS3096]EKJ79605.1 hypothetical protein FPSE_00290 [Fusarium pseudograminearum CS3096]
MDVITVPKPPPCQLPVAQVFDRLSSRQQLYAHYLSRASWHGSRIIMRGDWNNLADENAVNADQISAFLEYAGHFLYNMGNYWSEGDQKFIPDLSHEALRKLVRASRSPTAPDLLERVIEPMLSGPPYVLGYPSERAQSAYYPGDEKISKEEISSVSKAMEEHKIEPENTRLQKVMVAGRAEFRILQASTDNFPKKHLCDINGLGSIYIQSGDHVAELGQVCDALNKAKDYTENDIQRQVIEHYLESFKTGTMESFRDAQKSWVQDKGPVVESIMGFVEPYRDPHGVRGEWEGFVGISDPVESHKMRQFVDQSTTFIRLLPWAVSDVNDGKGPFEKHVFVAPDYTNSHSLVFCASYSFEATNVPNYNDIRETCGFKNIVVANRMNASNDLTRPCHYVHDSEAKRYRECTYIVRFVTTAIHELLGHGSGKLLSETKPGQFNFDRKYPPVSPLTNKPITTWYRSGQTWTSTFGAAAPSIEECRAMLVPLYLIDDKQLLSIFGYNETSDITTQDLHYNTYLQIGVEGLQGLAYYNVDERTWGQALKRAHWAILHHLLLDGDGVLAVEYGAQEGTLTVRVDKSKLLSHGKPSLGRFLCRIHIWRCTADVSPCLEYYDKVTAVPGDHEEWRELVAKKPEPRWKFIHANTFLKDGNVTVKEYENSNEGLIQSWVERGI